MFLFCYWLIINAFWSANTYYCSWFNYSWCCSIIFSLRYWLWLRLKLLLLLWLAFSKVMLLFLLLKIAVSLLSFYWYNYFSCLGAMNGRGGWAYGFTSIYWSKSSNFILLLLWTILLYFFYSAFIVILKNEHISWVNSCNLILSNWLNCHLLLRWIDCFLTTHFILPWVFTS